MQKSGGFPLSDAFDKVRTNRIILTRFIISYKENFYHTLLYDGEVIEYEVESLVA